jgi:hypothetical protein
MENIRVEYIILVETKNAFCNSVKAFNNLLEVNDDIKIEKNKIIKFKGLDISYEVQTGELNDKEQRFFHTKFTCKQVEKINEYSNFLRVVRDILVRVTGKQPVSLWDDVSFYYANKSYPLIHEIENLMRKLLTKFAVTKFDTNWTDKNIPEEVKTSVKNQSSNNDANYLYQTDFIQLIHFLSGKIKTSDVKGLLENISKAKDISELNLDELKSYIPTNNWDKYFSNIVEFEWEYFEKRWRKLYDLRCKVAHNNFLNKKDYEDICRLVDELKPKLQKAIDEMDKVSISTEDQEILAESFAVNTNAVYGEFINLWKIFEKELFDLIVKNQGDEPLKDVERYRFMPDRIARILVDKGLLSREFLIEVQKLRHLRNVMVHEVDISISETEIISKIDLLRMCLNQIRENGTK